MPGLVPGIHVFGVQARAWMAGTSPAMTVSNFVNNDLEPNYLMP
jgi:hypothetical protein